MSTETRDGAVAVKDDLSKATWFRDEGVQKVLDLLNADKGEARIVGGAVRNALMDIPVGDIDIATTLRPEEVVELAEKAGLKAVPTGLEHGTVTLVHEGRPFEVTTLRNDVKTDGRRAEVAFGTDWAEDAARRDLTINALYLDRHGRVIDLVDGLPDVAARTIRFIGDANLRISEDYLRILRFFRFFAWYGGGRPDAAGIKASARLKGGLEKLSAERVWSEMKKLLGAEDPGRALLWMRQAGVLTAVLPETEKWGIDAIGPLIDAEKTFGWKPDPLLRLTAIVPPTSERVGALSSRLKLSRAEAARLKAWCDTPPIAHDVADMAFDRMLYANDLQAVQDHLRLAFAAARARARSDTGALAEAAGYSRLIARADAWRRPDFPVSGKDLRGLGVPEGRELGAVLKRLEEIWIDSNFMKDRDDLLSEAAASHEG